MVKTGLEMVLKWLLVGLWGGVKGAANPPYGTETLKKFVDLIHGKVVGPCEGKTRDSEFKF